MRKKGLRALVTRKWFSCLTKTTIDSVSISSTISVWCTEKKLSNRGYWHFQGVKHKRQMRTAIHKWNWTLVEGKVRITYRVLGYIYMKDSLLFGSPVSFFILNNHQYPGITQSFGSMGPSSDDCGLLIWLRGNRFLCMQYPKILFFWFKDGTDLRRESFCL